MDFTGAKNKLAAVYELIQQLQVQPTKQNTEIILGCLNTLAEVFDELTEAEKQSKEDGPAVTEADI